MKTDKEKQIFEERVSEMITTICNKVLLKRFPNPGNVSNITWEAYLRGTAETILELLTNKEK